MADARRALSLSHCRDDYWWQNKGPKNKRPATEKHWPSGRTIIAINQYIRSARRTVDMSVPAFYNVYAVFRYILCVGSVVTSTSRNRWEITNERNEMNERQRDYDYVNMFACVRARVLDGSVLFCYSMQKKEMQTAKVSCSMLHLRTRPMFTFVLASSLIGVVGGGGGGRQMIRSQLMFTFVVLH